MLEGNFRFNYEEDALTLHLSYTHLPIKQYTNILTAIDGLYNDLLNLFEIDLTLILEPEEYNIFESSICLHSSQTGNSIINKITFDRRFFPDLTSAKSGGLDVHLPKWSMILFLAGWLLSYGQDFYKGHLEIKKLNLENEKIALELSKLKLEKLHDQANSNVNSIQMHLNQFYLEIHKENIINADLNGHRFKSR